MTLLEQQRSRYQSTCEKVQDSILGRVNNSLSSRPALNF